MGLNVDFTKVNKTLIPIDHCVVIDVGSGNFPRYIEVRMPGPDGARRTAWWSGWPNLEVDDVVLCHDEPNNPVLRIVGRGGDEGTGINELLVSKLVASDGDPDPALSADNDGDLTAVGDLNVQGDLSVGSYINVGAVSTPATPAASNSRIFYNTSERLSLVDDGGLVWPVSADIGEAIAQFLAIPGLRVFYPMFQDASGNAVDFGGLGHDLTMNGTPTYGKTSTGLSYINLDGTAGTAQYLSMASDHADLDLLGTESYIEDNGFTIGCLAYIGTGLDGFATACISKSTGSNVAKNYELLWRGDSSTDKFDLRIANSSTQYNVQSQQVSADDWYFVVARFVPSTSLDIWVDDTKTSNTTSIPASANNSTDPFMVGLRSVNLPFDGLLTWVFASAVAVSDDYIEKRLWPYVRPLIGK